MHKKLFIVLLAFAALSSGLHAQMRSGAFSFYFPEGGDGWGPDAALKAFVSDSLSGVDVLTVRIDGYASPTGTLPFNRKLSWRRVSVVESWLRERGVEGRYILTGHGEDWEGLFAGLEGVGYDRGKAAQMIADMSAWSPSDSAKLRDGRVYSRRKVVLQSLDGGKVYDNLSDVLFPKLRRTDVIIEYRLKDEPVMVPPETPAPVPVPVPEPEPVVVPEPEPEPVIEPEPVEGAVSPEQAARGFIICTNFVLDAVLVPNIGTVVPLGKGWALDLRYGGAWWSVPEKDFWWRAYGGELAIRKYFPRKEEIDEPWRTVSGHHVGLYGQFFTYDFELGGSGQMGGTPKMNIFDNPQYAGGLEYGYTFELGRNFNLDLSLGLGYAGGLYHEYEPWEGKYVWRSTMRRFWLGPTRAEVTLQWLLGSARNPQRKEVNHD